MVASRLSVTGEKVVVWIEVLTTDREWVKADVATEVRLIR